ncbi:hypothetical protein EA756_08760 [Acinetobacter lactucae]|uniref:Uncharacterized protein n=1 Tax=Acinetobacter lactucae TaxID=1785128 RepID=A0A429K0V6_9GAMM|nr:hypothetical protein [Acinetobacter lactucae]RSO57573.1 hypothetical protein EA756_08760 [Acinetobacter lactucae]
MENYKIKVNDEAEAIQSRDLFRELGFSPDSSRYGKYVTWVAVFEDGSGSFYSSDTNLDECQELTLPQLRDLVVLHRNDVKDATHVHGQDSSMPFYVSSSNEIYLFYPGKTDHWTTSKFPIHCLKPIHNPQTELGLISGAEALRALADGKEIQWVSTDFKNWNDLDIWNANLKTFLNEKYIAEGEFKFRLKPRTTKLELEIPAPFEPKVGEEYFYLNSGRESGYAMKLHDGKQMDFMAIQFGAWRTEEEIKKVVEQLRKIRGAS